MKALFLSLVLSLAALGSGAYALVHAIEATVSTATISQAQAANVSPQVAQVLAML